MTFRQATIDDASHLAQFAITAHAGTYEVVYDGLFPDQSIESLIEPRFARSGTTTFYENHWIAIQDRQVAGGMLAIPFDNLANDPPTDPRIPDERFAIFQPFNDLPAPGTYYVNVLLVYPEFCRRGIASSLLALAFEDAKKKAFTEISVHVFAENFGAVALYEKSGFKVVGHKPFVEHPLVRYTGEVFLMSAYL